MENIKHKHCFNYCRVRREIYIQGASPTTNITDNFNKKDKGKGKRILLHMKSFC